MHSHASCRRNARAPVAGAPVEAVEPRVLLTTYLVTNTNDSGTGSLRDAITGANANAGADIINFNIPGAGVHTIKPTSALPAVTGPVLIDGYSQPGAARNTDAVADNAKLEIEIDGSLNNGSLDLAFGVGSSGSELRGIVLNHATGISIDSGSHSDTIDGNFLGTDPTGMSASGGIVTPILALDSSLLLIGGITPAARNVIANGSRYGILLNGGNGNTVRGNLIGVAADGRTAIGNRVGLGVVGENHDTIGGNTAASANVISGSRAFFGSAADSNGVELNNAPQNLIQGNLIGTDATGLVAVPNQGDGLLADGASRASNIIGNTISANAGDGLAFTAIATMPPSTIQTISGNFIGTDPTGTHALGNGGAGLVLVGASNVVNNNVISANHGTGIDIKSEGQNVIRGNLIGTDASRTTNLGNGADGILIESASNNTIGGTAADAPNTIAFNAGNGVTVGLSPTAGPVNNRISANSIFFNGRLGIDLGNDGVTANTPGGPHVGPNMLQNYPQIGFVRSDPTGTHVTGTLNSTPGRVFSVEFFASPTADPSGFGEGMTYLGSVQVSTDNAGNSHFNDVATPVAAPVGSIITATATDAVGNTSEFSAGPPAHLSGDVNGDRKVNFTDLLTLAQHYGHPGTLPDGDLNADGQVNFSDLLILAQNYGQTVATTSASISVAQPDDPSRLVRGRKGVAFSRINARLVLK